MPSIPVINLKQKKIAIVHDSFTHFGGAERVLIALLKLYPQADVFSSIISPQYMPLIESFTKGKIFYSKLSNLNLAQNNPSLFKPYFYHYYWNNLDFTNYDLVISSSHSYCSNWVKVTGKHMSYIHTPPRFLYGNFNEMFWIYTFPLNLLLYPYFSVLRQLDKYKFSKIDKIIANSKTTQQRILKIYNRNSIIVYPPTKKINTKIDSRKSKPNTYLFFSRLVNQKGAELVIKSFNLLNKPLIVVGIGSKESYLKKIAQPNIKFLGFVSDAHMSQIYSQSKALVYASIDEDFGLVPVEAMSYGLPVIAYNSGGVKETVINGKTGVFYNQHSTKSLIKAIETFEKLHIKSIDCINRSKQFDENIFTSKINQHVRELLS